ncbi:MAG: TIGR00725 family protein [Planctomycetes bacterium]|nr:TIGR00725 family protein [Planctomycetota bacterium]
MVESRKEYTVAVVGNGSLSQDDPRIDVARAVGKSIVDEGYTLVTGGLGGLMEAACEGGRSSDGWTHGRIVGILPGHDPKSANPFVDVVIATGLDIARNAVVAHADAVVAIGGGAGTLSEMAIAWQFNRLLIAMRVDGWSGALADQKIDDRERFPDFEYDRVFGADTAEDVAKLLESMLPMYRRRYTSATTVIPRT